jgi:adenylate cyclase
MIEPTPGGESAASGQRATRLLAVLAADVVDYTRLTEAAELETHARLRALRVGIIDPCVVSYRGQIIKNTGDGFLATFDSSVDALRCAVEIQGEVFQREASTPRHLRIQLRIGLNVGQVITEEEDIYGTSVNVAARLEQFSPPGGIVISDAMHAIARSRMACRPRLAVRPAREIAGCRCLTLPDDWRRSRARVLRRRHYR